jgi:hypothetical protein
VTRTFITALTLVLLSGLPHGSVVPTTDAEVFAGQTARPGAPAPIRSALLNEKDSIKFGVIGDSGTGNSAQRAIGELLAKARARFPFEFVIMLGDNMYGGESPSDFVRKFEQPYKPILDAGVKFYASLGNHDEPSQRFYKPFNMEGKRYYTFKKGDVEFFVLDSTYMTPEQAEWLDGELGKSSARWKIAYAHHPLYSSGKKHGSEEDFRAVVEPLFIKHGVNVVFAGHEHFYERLHPQKGIHYFTAGGSAKLRSGNIARRSPLTAKGFDSDRSFMLVEVTKDQLLFEAISRKAQIVDAGAIMHRERDATGAPRTTTSTQ